ncbi:hypothetical protein OAD91_01505 [Synechococcus sp. AH-551-E19]|nr:hypothetical protein [Synechococcus sp. AH-551-E19]
MTQDSIAIVVSIVWCGKSLQRCCLAAQGGLSHRPGQVVQWSCVTVSTAGTQASKMGLPLVSLLAKNRLDIRLTGLDRV